MFASIAQASPCTSSSSLFSFARLPMLLPPFYHLAARLCTSHTARLFLTSPFVPQATTARTCCLEGCRAAVSPECQQRRHRRPWANEKNRQGGFNNKYLHVFARLAFFFPLTWSLGMDRRLSAGSAGTRRRRRDRRSCKRCIET